MRISESLKLECSNVRLKEGFAFVPDSKNGEPQPVHLPPYMIEALSAHQRGLDRRAA